MTKNIPARLQNFFGMQQKSEATAFFRNSKKKKIQRKKMTSTCRENSTMHATPSKKRNAFFSFLIFPNMFSMVF